MMRLITNEKKIGFVSEVSAFTNFTLSVEPPDEGLGSSGKRYGSGSLGSGSAGSGSMYLSDSQDWVVSPSCSPDEGPGQHPAISPVLAEETLRYMSKHAF